MTPLEGKKGGASDPDHQFRPKPTTGRLAFTVVLLAALSSCIKSAESTATSTERATFGEHETVKTETHSHADTSVFVGDLDTDIDKVREKFGPDGGVTSKPGVGLSCIGASLPYLIAGGVVAVLALTFLVKRVVNKLP